MIRIYINILLLLLGVYPLAQTNSTRESQIKAAFIFNFTQFVEWPPNTFPESNAPLIIGVLGENPFGNYLKEIVSGEKINGHPLVVRQYQNVEDIKTCHILFINLSEKNKVKQAITTLKDQSILTISDGNNFIKQGGIVRFFKKNNKIRIQINPVAAKETGLVISSKLLSVADIASSNNN